MLAHLSCLVFECGVVKQKLSSFTVEKYNFYVVKPKLVQC